MAAELDLLPAPKSQEVFAVDASASKLMVR
jgi:hypothetical protein